MTESRTLPPFPTDRATLSLLRTAVNPWATTDGASASCSSLGNFLEFMSQLGGSDTEVYEEELDDGMAVLRDPQYSTNDVIEALVDEIERLRGEQKQQGFPETMEEVKERIGWHFNWADVVLVLLVLTGIIAAVVSA